MFLARHGAMECPWRHGDVTPVFLARRHLRGHRSSPRAPSPADTTSMPPTPGHTVRRASSRGVALARLSRRQLLLPARIHGASVDMAAPVAPPTRARLHGFALAEFLPLSHRLPYPSPCARLLLARRRPLAGHGRRAHLAVGPSCLGTLCPHPLPAPDTSLRLIARLAWPRSVPGRAATVAQSNLLCNLSLHRACDSTTVVPRA